VHENNADNKRFHPAELIAMLLLFVINDKDLQLKNKRKYLNKTYGA